MIIIRKHDQPLDEMTLVDWLREIRRNAYPLLSAFSVAAILLTRDEEGNYVYVAGVNVENDIHNRLGVHAEQCALSTLNSIFLAKPLISQVWVMGGPQSELAPSANAIADQQVMPCGHCRQILSSFSDATTEVFSVTINGSIHREGTLTALLPNAFSEQDFAPSVRQTVIGEKPLVSCMDLAIADVVLAADDIFPYLVSMTPHIFNDSIITSPTTQVIFRLENGVCIPGCLLQDIAFLTTDAISSALCHAVSRFSATLRIAEIHCYSTAKRQPHEWLTALERMQLNPYISEQTKLFAYAKTGKVIEHILL